MRRRNREIQSRNRETLLASVDFQSSNREPASAHRGIPFASLGSLFRNLEALSRFLGILFRFLEALWRCLDAAFSTTCVDSTAKHTNHAKSGHANQLPRKNTRNTNPQDRPLSREGVGGSDGPNGSVSVPSSPSWSSRDESVPLAHRMGEGSGVRARGIRAIRGHVSLQSRVNIFLPIPAASQ